MIKGETLRVLRLIKGKKQKDVARQLGISQQAYAKIEHQATVTNDYAMRISNILEYRRDELTKLSEVLSLDEGFRRTMGLIDKD